ncbi:MAG: sodium-translocating pyrophosphatase [Planctomycetota bacterium]|nr:sodium-translocating pyrophosphatase [Planctomycetota bacterium]
MCWGLLLLGAIAALGQARMFYQGMREADEGSEKMIEIAGHVREGAAAYLTQQYKVVGVFMLVVSFLLFLAGQSGVQEKLVFLAFLTGGFWSGLAGFIGMRTATQASSRTAAGAQHSLNEGLQVAFRSGAVMGLTVVGLGMLDMAIWYMILKFFYSDILNNTGTIINTMLCSLMGASSQALFARVGGGIFTKAADVGADLVGKVEKNIPEDDPRNPATIADNVGDNVGDVAGMGADLYESYCGSILATAALGVAAAATNDFGVVEAVFLPMLVASFGTIISIVGIYLVQAGEDASQKSLLGVIGFGINTATVGVVLLALLLSFLLLEKIGVGISICVGLAAGWLIGKWTEYATSDEFTPTQNLAGQAITGPATVIIGGIADGMKSVWAPILIICAGTISAFGFANDWNFADTEAFSLGLYGVGIAAVGMLSTLGITLATDAYGPIADNAGGNAEMSGLEPLVRERTDALDSLGNTTAATGKGFAIGSAALTALALLAAYVEQVRVGYERWTSSVEQKVVAESTGDGFYKVSAGFVVHVKNAGNSDDVTSQGYLIMPESLRSLEKPTVAEWKKLPAIPTAPSKIDTEIISMKEVEEQGSDGKTTKTQVPVLSETGSKLIAISRATLPDFAQYYNASLLNPMVLVGIFLGCMATFVFCAMTMQAVGRAAQGMVEEVRRQFREKPGIMDGSEKPDYSTPVAISTKAAQREMLLPSLLGLITPVVVGMLLGVGGVIGLLVGTLTCGFCVAIFMANSGGAWDNAKKYIEAGHLEKDGQQHGKGSEAHKAAVVGDTVGDPFKDTSGPSLNILIKLMSIVSVVAAGFVVRFCLMNWL